MEDPADKSLEVVDGFDKIRAALIKYGYTFKSDVHHLFCLYNKEVAIIFQKNKTTGAISTHIRASIKPNHAALIGAITFGVVKARIGDNFEFNSKGEWLFGDRALRYASINMEYLWFDNPDHDALEEKDALEAYEEAKLLDKKTFN